MNEIIEKQNENLRKKIKNINKTNREWRFDFDENISFDSRFDENSIFDEDELCNTNKFEDKKKKKSTIIGFIEMFLNGSFCGILCNTVDVKED